MHAAHTYCDSLRPMTEDDVAALSALYSSSNGADWAINEGWLDGGDACGWRSSAHNEACSSSGNSTGENSTVCCTPDARAEHIFLYSNGLDGPIPTTIGALTELRSLALHSNELRGGVPTELGLLTGLQKLSLHGNALSGLLPSELGRLSDLRACFLSPGNEWRCPVPAELPAACTPALVRCADFPAPPPSPLPPPSPPPSPSHPPPLHPPPSSVGPAGALLIGAALALATLCLLGCAVILVCLFLRRRIARRQLTEAGRGAPVLSAPPCGEAKPPVSSGGSGADEEAPRGDGGGGSSGGGGGEIPAARPETERAAASEHLATEAAPRDGGGGNDAPPPSCAEAVLSPPKATEQRRPAEEEVGEAVELPAILLEVLQAERLGDLCQDWEARGAEERRTKLRDLQRACHPDKHRSSAAAEAAATNAFQHLATLAERAGLAKKSPKKGRGREGVPHSRACGADATPYEYDGMQHRYADGERPEL